MGRDTELTAYLLRYLLEAHFFRSKEEMAQSFGVSKRQIQRIMNTSSRMKGGTITLSKVLNYFGVHQIPFDPVLMQYLKLTPSELPSTGVYPAYMQMQFSSSDVIGPEGEEALRYCREFIGLMSSYACPHCKTWCNPWAGSDRLFHQRCIVSQTASALLQSIEQEYTQRT